MFNPENHLSTEVHGNEDPERKWKILEAINLRTRQTYGSRLAEFITGLRPDDPEMVSRLISDHEVIRGKYRLPDRLQIQDSAEYERFLRNIAKKLQIEIRETSDCGSFFQDAPYASGVYLGEMNKVGVNIKRESSESHMESMNVLEHELIHGMQKRHSPAMPVELKEYEAYIAGINVDLFKDYADPELIEALFRILIGSSVDHFYASKSNKEGKEIVPPWNNPKFFLENVDHLSADEIEEYYLKYVKSYDYEVE